MLVEINGVRLHVVKQDFTGRLVTSRGFSDEKPDLIIKNETIIPVWINHNHEQYPNFKGFLQKEELPKLERNRSRVLQRIEKVAEEVLSASDYEQSRGRGFLVNFDGSSIYISSLSGYAYGAVAILDGDPDWDCEPLKFTKIEDILKEKNVKIDE